MLVPNCLGAELSVFFSWCQIVGLPSLCQIVCLYYLGAKLFYRLGDDVAGDIYNMMKYVSVCVSQKMITSCLLS